ncbi:MAG: hypothetical protein COA78_22180 [Blastopirellula sp.]|nr:MAG: hypothetical protein COA78_22180 [Blastopirellula sp.]
MSSIANDPINCTRIADPDQAPEHYGLTKREYFAGLAIQGNMAWFESRDVEDLEGMAHDCVLFADYLIKELEKEKK